jgi:hypothetical protein
VNRPHPSKLPQSPDWFCQNGEQIGLGDLNTQLRGELPPTLKMSMVAIYQYTIHVEDDAEGLRGGFAEGFSLAQWSWLDVSAWPREAYRHV